MGSRPGTGVPLGTVLFVALTVLTVVAFGVTRVARSGDDLVNTVELAPTVSPGGAGSVDFDLAEPDRSVDVLIIDGNPGSDDAQVRALATDVPLPAGPQSFSWDGSTDDGGPAPPGLYALRVVLGEQGRDVLPPGRIRVPEAGE
ncbi:MAG: FlgD immunoglobulin-like domain containing protein [Solirubrobacterales bacterium]